MKTCGRPWVIQGAVVVYESVKKNSKNTWEML